MSDPTNFNTGWSVVDSITGKNFYNGEIGQAPLSINGSYDDAAFAAIVAEAFMDIGRSVTARSIANAANLQTVTITVSTVPGRPSGAQIIAGVGIVVISAADLGFKYGVAGKKGVYAEFDVRHALAHELAHVLGVKGKLTMPEGVLHNKLTNKILKELGIQPRTNDYFDTKECFIAGTIIDMWPLDLKPDVNRIYDEQKVLAKVWQKPIEEVTPDDWVVSYDDNGRLKPGRVTRTFENHSKHILDVHGLMMTPGHVTYCAKVKGEENRFADSHVPVMDILRSDGALKKNDGTLIRAATGCEVGSEDDEQFWTFLLYEDNDGSERIREKCQLRLGTRWMLPNGNHFSMREYMNGIGVELIEEGPHKGYVRFKQTGAITVFAWTLSQTLPKPEDYVLQRSQVTLEEIYSANEWEAVRPQIPAPFMGEMGHSFKQDSTLYAGVSDSQPPNIPLSMRNSPNQPTMSRQQRRALERKQKKAEKRSGATVH